MTSVTTTIPHLAVERHASRLKDVIRYVRSRCTLKQVGDVARNVAKAVLSSRRSRAIEQVVTLVIDVAQRGTLEEAEAIGLELVAIARTEYAAAHPSERPAQLSIDEASIAEQAAQGERECAEKAMDLFPTTTNRLRFLAASRRYEAAAKVLDDAVRRELASHS